MVGKVKKITVAIAQMKVVPAQPEVNLRRGEEFIAQASRRGSDLICFPEMWTTGFDWEFNRRYAVEHEKIIERVGELARLHSIWITGSLLSVDDRGRFTNAAILFSPRGERTAVYRKTHLFTLFQEDRYVTPGDKLVVADTPWGKAGFSICYDLRFPELFRFCALRGAVMQFLPAAWPHPRREHWEILVRARAIENQIFVIAANRIGYEDIPGEGKVTYCGTSLIVDPAGRVVATAGEDEEKLLTARIDLGRVEGVRKGIPTLKDRRPELYSADNFPVH